MRVRAYAAPFLLALTSCAVNPATGAREFMLVSEGQEVSMGRESDPAVTAQYGLVDDPELQAYVSRLGMGIAEVSERPQLPWPPFWSPARPSLPRRTRGRGPETAPR